MTIIYSELEELVTQTIVKRFSILDALESQTEVSAVINTLTNIVTLFSIRSSLVLNAQSLRMSLPKALNEMISEYTASIGQGGRDAIGFNESHNILNEMYDLACTILPYYTAEEWVECYRNIDIHEGFMEEDEVDRDIDIIDIITVLIATSIKSRTLLLTLSDYRKENTHGRHSRKK